MWGGAGLGSETIVDSFSTGLGGPAEKAGEVAGEKKEREGRREEPQVCCNLYVNYQVHLKHIPPLLHPCSLVLTI